MTPVGKALWFIESHLHEEVSLAEIAGVGGVTRHHMVRAFAAATGRSVIRYLRARRLTEAALRLAAGAPDILMVALDAGYGSHEAFTRAFRDQFGTTPERVRGLGTAATLTLQEPIRMDETRKTTLAEPRRETTRAMRIAGLADHFGWETRAAIPNLWQRFVPWLGAIPGQVGAVTYGVCFDTDDSGGFTYLAGVEVSAGAELPDGLRTVSIPAQNHLVFTHAEHVSAIQATFAAIFDDWLPTSQYQLAPGAVFERYDERFDPHSGLGGFEIWVPIRS